LMNEVLSRFTGILSTNDLEFFSRVWSTESEVYSQRVRAMGFVGLEKILDAGCGMGQWSLALASKNDHVFGVDVSEDRARIAAKMNHGLGAMNTAFSVQSVERLAFRRGAFDGIYCYSVLYTTEHRATLREFHRVLRPGGLLHICGNGIGWYLRNVILGSRKSLSYDVRQGALAALRNTLLLALSGSTTSGIETIISSRKLEAELRELGFQQIRRGAEGTLGVQPGAPISPFFPKHWLGLEYVYEIAAVRSEDG
jgi:ubiquinone/menaquinone biosynthesis C-methylase UbiE